MGGNLKHQTFLEPFHLLMEKKINAQQNLMYYAIIL